MGSFNPEPDDLSGRGTASEAADALIAGRPMILLAMPALWRLSADFENWTSADTKSETPGSYGGAVAGSVSGGSVGPASCPEVYPKGHNQCFVDRPTMLKSGCLRT